MSPLCYVHAPELDERYRTPEGWVRTGDRGFLDDDGRLRLVGRSKEIVIRGGTNISPAEVEVAVAAHEDVVSVACLGIPDADLGQRVCACVALRAGAPPLDMAGLGAFLDSSGLERRKFPEQLVVLDELPITPAGKVDKRALLELVTRTVPRDPVSVRAAVRQFTEEEILPREACSRVQTAPGYSPSCSSGRGRPVSGGCTTRQSLGALGSRCPSTWRSPNRRAAHCTDPPCSAPTPRSTCGCCTSRAPTASARSTWPRSRRAPPLPATA